MVECWVVVPRDAGSSPVFRAFNKFLGALTSKTYSFQYRTWELRSQVFFDFSDYFFPLIKLQFRGSELIRVLPVPASWLPWISDTIRFNLSFVFNFRSTHSQSLFFIPTRLVTLVFKIFKLKFFSPCFFSNLFSGINFEPFYSKQAPTSRKLDSNLNQFFFFFFSNIKELSPSYLAFLRTNLSTKLVFFGCFFDVRFAYDRVTFFNSDIFFKLVFYKTSYLINIFKSSSIRIFSSVSVKTLRNFTLITKKFILFPSSINFGYSPVSYTFSLKSFPSFFSNFFDFVQYDPNSFSFHPLLPSPLINPTQIYFDCSQITPSIYSKKTISFPFPNLNTYLSNRFFVSPYSKLFSFRKSRKYQSIYLCLIRQSKNFSVFFLQYVLISLILMFFLSDLIFQIFALLELFFIFLKISILFFLKT